MSVSLVVIFVLTALLAIQWNSSIIRRNEDLLKAGREILRLSFREFSPIPELELGWAHGMPYFQLVFPTIESQQIALKSNQLTEFKESIGSLCSKYHRSGENYEASEGVRVTSLEETKDQKLEAAAYPSRTKDSDASGT